MVVNENTLCCHRHEYSIQLLSIDTGEVLMEKRPATDLSFYILDTTHILCRVTAYRWEIIRTTDLAVVDSFSNKEFLSPVDPVLAGLEPSYIGEQNWVLSSIEFAPDVNGKGDGVGDFVFTLGKWINDNTLMQKLVYVPYTLKDK